MMLPGRAGRDIAEDGVDADDADDGEVNEVPGDDEVTSSWRLVRPERLTRRLRCWQLSESMGATRRVAATERKHSKVPPPTRSTKGMAMVAVAGSYTMG